MKAVGCNRLGGRQVPWSTIKRKGKKWSILYRLHSGRSPRFDWAGLSADLTSRILRLIPASGAFRIRNALVRPGGIAWIVRMGNAQQKSLALPRSCDPKVSRHGIRALLVRGWTAAYQFDPSLICINA
jgi:hypothetical protein